MSNSDHQIIRCQCDAKLKVPVAAAGRRVKCPKCGFKIELPAPGAKTTTVQPPPASVQAKPATAQARPVATAAKPVSRPAKAAAPPEIPDDGDSLMDDLMQLESSAETSSHSSVARSQKLCSNCGKPMPSDGRTCLACGHSTVSAPKRKPSGPGAGAVVASLAKSGGRFVLGCVLSAVAALIGAGVWFGICQSTGFEIGWIAWGVGILAGFGMLFGYGKQNLRAGVVAASMALAGVVLGKALVFGYVIYAMMSGASGNIEHQRAFLAGCMTNEILVDRGVSEADWDAQWDEVSPGMEAQVAAMSDDEVRERAGEFRATAAAEGGDDAQGEDSGDATAENDDNGTEELAGSALGFFFQTMFGVLDVVFIGLAVVTAFKIAGGSGNA